MTTSTELCRALGVDEADARRALDADAGAEAAGPAGWLAQLIVGIGAWVTALAAIGLGAVIVFTVIAAEEPAVLALVGGLFFAAGLLVLRRPGAGTFFTQLGTALAAAGIALAAAGLGLRSEEVWVSALVASAATLAVIFLTASRALQFLAALLAAVLFCFTLTDQQVPWRLDLAALAGPLGVAALLAPPRRDVRPTAIVQLLVLPLYGAFTAHWVGLDGGATTDPGGWLAKGLHLALFLGLVVLHRHWSAAAGGARTPTPLLVFGAAAVGVCLLLPPGGSAALVIMMLAFVLGGHVLAGLGVALESWYLCRFYYDLELTLLVKSGLLVAVGVVVLGAWWALARAGGGAEREA